MKVSVIAIVALSIFGESGVFAAPSPESEISIVAKKSLLPVIGNIAKRTIGSQSHMETKFIRRGIFEQPFAFIESEWMPDKGTFDEFKKSGKMKENWQNKMQIKTL